MKKRLSLIFLLLCLVLVCVACQKKKEAGQFEEPLTTKEAGESKAPSQTQQPTEDGEVTQTVSPAETVAPEATVAPEDDIKNLDTNVDGINLMDYIDTLGEYKGVEVKIYSTEVTEEEIQKEVDAILESYPTYEEIQGGIAADGNYVNIDFVGKIDGKEFEGGSAYGAELLLGSDTYIDGFEDGIIGMKKGETRDLELTFPDDYSNAEYAGKDAVFTVKLNSIMNRVETKYDDKFVKDNFYTDYKLSTVEEMNKYLETTLETQKKETAKSHKISSVMEAIVEDTSFKELPQQWVNKYYVEEYTYYQEVAGSYGLGFEEYLSYYGITVEAFKEDCLNYATKAVKEDIVLEAIAQAEKIEVTDEYYNEQINILFRDYSAYYEDVDAFVADNGGKEEVKNKLMLIKTRDFVVDNATVVGTVTEIE